MGQKDADLAVRSGSIGPDVVDVTAACTIRASTADPTAPPEDLLDGRSDTCWRSYVQSRFASFNTGCDALAIDL